MQLFYSEEIFNRYKATYGLSIHSGELHLHKRKCPNLLTLVLPQFARDFLQLTKST